MENALFIEMMMLCVITFVFWLVVYVIYHNRQKRIEKMAKCRAAPNTNVFAAETISVITTCFAAVAISCCCLATACQNSNSGHGDVVEKAGVGKQKRSTQTSSDNATLNTRLDQNNSNDQERDRCRTSH